MLFSYYGLGTVTDQQDKRVQRYKGEGEEAIAWRPTDTHSSICVGILVSPGTTAVFISTPCLFHPLAFVALFSLPRAVDILIATTQVFGGLRPARGRG